MASPNGASMDVVEITDERRFELHDQGAVVGVLDYEVRGEHWIFTHTTIDPDRRGEGLGDVLVAGALAEARAQGMRIIPRCWFVEDHIARHPDLADLLAG